MNIAFVTQAAKPDITADDKLAADLLRNAGHVLTGVPWTADVDWQAYDSVVIRSPWDYHHYPPERFSQFLDRLERTGASVHNPAAVLKWNAHKGYLLELAKAGIPVVETKLLARGSRPNLAELVAPYERAVLKPAFAAGAIHTWVTGPTSAADDEARLHERLDRTDVLVQPYLPDITTAGEYSLLFFNGVFSHAVLKRPKAGDFRVQEKHGGSTTPIVPAATLIEQARRVLAAVPVGGPDPLLYARVDGVMLNGTFTLMELEALEPALFLATHPQAPENFARAILATLR